MKRVIHTNDIYVLLKCLPNELDCNELFKWLSGLSTMNVPMKVIP